MSKEHTGALESGGETERRSDSPRDVNTQNISASLDLLRPLSCIYPDIEAEYLHQTCQRFNNRPAEIQSFLEEKLPSLPLRSTRPPARLKVLEGESLWQCPGCSSWQIIQLQPDQAVISCSQLVSCGQFCSKCNSHSHAPFNCRISKKLRTSTVQDTEEEGVFKRLSGETAMIIYHRDITYELFPSCC